MTKANPALARALDASRRAAFGFGGVPGMVNDGPDYTTDLSDPMNNGGYIGYADGGAPGMDPQAAMDAPIFAGPVNAPVGGRTDHLPVHVASGSYVIPADIVSSMGEGNTITGFKVVEQMFPPGGQAPADDTPVPVVIAGGEYVLSPEQVAIAGQGDVDVGHQVLDAFVKRFRALTVKTLSKLPGPKKN